MRLMIRKFMLLLFFGFCVVMMVNAGDITQRAEKRFLIPGNYQTRVDYQSGTNPIYVGVADRGLATSDKGWLIMKITWDANDNPTLIQTVYNSIWDSRTSYTYQ